MTRAAVVTILTLCCCRVSLVAAAENPKATCVAGNEPQMTKISRVGAITIECPEDYDLNPAPPADGGGQQTVLMAPQATATTQAVNKACPGVGCVKPVGNAKGHTLTVRQLPPQPATFFFRCVKKGNEQDDCYIGIEVASHSRLGPNTCAMTDSKIDFSVQKAGEVVNFACATNTTLEPQKDKHAYDETCEKEIELPEDIALTKPGNDVYNLTVQKLAAAPHGICYVCTGTNMKCRVRIAIASQGFAAASAHTAAGLGLILAAVVFLHVQ